jgi:hypothetical protein
VTIGPVTTDDILDAAEKRTGLTRPQLLVLVAKSATVRHLATHEKYKDLFVPRGSLRSSYRYDTLCTSCREERLRRCLAMLSSSTAI